MVSAQVQRKKETGHFDNTTLNRFGVVAPTSAKRARSPKLPISYGRIGALVAAGDFIAIVLLGIALSTCYDFFIPEGHSYSSSCTVFGVISASVFILCMQAQHLYRSSAVLNRSTASSALFMTWTFVFAALIGCAFFGKITVDVSRLSVFSLFVGGLIVLPMVRFFGRRMLRSLIASDGLSGRTRIVLMGEVRQLSAMNMGTRLKGYGYNVVKEIALRIERNADAQTYRDLVGSVDAIRNFISENRVDEIFLLFDSRDQRVIDIASESLKALPVPVRLLFDRNLNSLLTKQIVDLGPTRAARIQEGPLTASQQILKRAFDIVTSLAGLVALSPMFLMIAILVKMDSPGPALFRQRRAGFSGRTFQIYKFRTMTVMDDGEVIKQATRGDQRVTRVGRFLRAASLDELPQLLNVLKGEMSLVGPRPHALSHDDQYEKMIASYALRNHVKPGITGWAQINGCRGETAELFKMEQRVQHDLYYIGHWSLGLDLWITAKTALQVVRPSNVY